ncbi:MAG: hypothetical protein R2813_08695 [Flavobacteriales bacterium]
MSHKTIKLIQNIMTKQEIEKVYEDSLKQLKTFLKTANKSRIHADGYRYIRIELNLPELEFTTGGRHSHVSSSLQVYLEDYLIDNRLIDPIESKSGEHSGLNHMNIIRSLSDESKLLVRSNCLNRKRKTSHVYKFRCETISDLCEMYYGCEHIISRMTFSGEEDKNRGETVVEVESKSTFREVIDTFMNTYYGYADLDNFDLIVESFDRADQYDGTLIKVASSKWEHRLETALSIEKSYERDSSVDDLLSDGKEEI